MGEVRIWEEQVTIPTYEVGEPDRNPMFLEKRVYQGSSGKVYPYPTTEKISREKKDKVWNAVYLENEYLKIMVLPALGGRIQRAYDKTNGYDFVYYNHVIKPALVGLAGPWISGGIEFNWPQHHRPTTYMPVDHLIRENEDGSKTLLVHDVDQMYGTKGIAAFTLYPGKAYLEVRGQLYNRTALPQTFLWWANPAVPVNDHTQSIFPPDVHNVYDHGKRAVSRFPIAKGVYYKHDYSEGVDISRYKNIPVPTSYMAETSKYDFVGGYDYQKEAGLLHVADHHFSPGKKQWTWGCGEFGKAWDRNLTDEDGPYIELMTGVYTENQPDFTWLKPFEEKTFRQYFMPYKKVGQVKNATIHAALNVEVAEGHIHVTVYATEKYACGEIVVRKQGEEIARERAVLSPVDIYERTIEAQARPEEVCVSVYGDGKLLVRYQAEKERLPKLAEPAEAAMEPEQIRTNEELLLTGQHIEQHRHATYLPDPYYLEGLKRDGGDIRLNNAYGLLLLRRGDFETAEKHFRAAIDRMTWRSPNPYNSEAYYNLGLALFYQGRKDEAYDAFYKATWSNEQQEMSFYYLAVIAAADARYEEALELAEKGLVKNAHNVKARGLRALLLRRLGRQEEALAWIGENLALDPFDYVSRCELEQIANLPGSRIAEQAVNPLGSQIAEQMATPLDSRNAERTATPLGEQAGESEGLQSGSQTGRHDVEEARSERRRLMRGFHENYLQTARDYAEMGAYEEACAVLAEYGQGNPMILYYLGYYLRLAGKPEEGAAAHRLAEQQSPYCCFPNKLEDIAVLQDAISCNPQSAKAYYYLGNLYYDKLQFARAVKLWETSVSLDDSYPTVHRNLALACYNKLGDVRRARKELEKAFALDETDVRVFLELDQLYKRLGVSAEERLESYERHRDIIGERDDVMLEYVTLCNLAGAHERAYEALMSHSFRPWEGAEGRVCAQYKVALVELAKRRLLARDYRGAKELLERSLAYPENLGEGRLEGTKDNHIYYYLGEAAEGLGQTGEAAGYYERAQLGEDEPAGMLYYYDQPADMILYKGLACLKTGRRRAAYACFNKLMDYGERHLRDVMKPDFFAVSLPDFLIFEEDMDRRNRAHCHYLMGLAAVGFGELAEAREQFEEALREESSHQNAVLYLRQVQTMLHNDGNE